MFKWTFLVILNLALMSIFIFSYFMLDAGRIINIKLIIILGTIGWMILFIISAIKWNFIIKKYGCDTKACYNCEHANDPICMEKCKNYNKWKKNIGET